jgi:DNA-directed RNA polymerase specialized sigma24 family protein
LDGLSPADVAQRLGMEIGAVYTAKCRVIAKLREAATRRQLRQERGSTPS